ncbi:FAD-binding domain-containing protein [Dentipellis sp. KUC8613]|nr:FAD-binding domain-containing protein [Dentipellis sp. KUC8613]
MQCLLPALALSSPSASQWQALSQQVDGRLYQSSPLAAPCFKDFSSTECQAIQKGYANDTFRSDSFGAYVNVNWETCQTTGVQCLLDSSNPSDVSPTLPPNQCQLGSIPEYYIDVRTPGDVAAAFKFSKHTQVPLVVKNTGHDYKGRSSAPGSLALWTHNLKNITYDAAFVAEGCKNSQPGMTVGAGVQWGEAYNFAEANNITVVGGSDPGVGVSGGWVQGGGHGVLSNTMGLGVDRVLQYRVVTPDGKYLVANACQNEDLFFALRGGGGGTFGVVLESTILASPPVPLQAVVVLWRPTANLTQSIFSLLVDNAVKWADEGWGGLANDQSVIYVNPKPQTQTQSNSSMAPLIQFGERLLADGVPGTQLLVLQFPTFGSFFNTFAVSQAASSGLNLALASRLIPRANFASASARSELVTALMNAHSTASSLRLLIGPPSSFPGDGTTSINPAWRDSIYHVTLIETWAWNSTLADKQKQFSDTSKAIDFLRKITPDAAYLNESDVHEPNFEVSFWGDNYEKLLAIKRKYDPDHLLGCWQCVGWNPDSSRYQCYI